MSAADIQRINENPAVQALLDLAAKSDAEKLKMTTNINGVLKGDHFTFKGEKYSIYVEFGGVGKITSITIRNKNTGNVVGLCIWYRSWCESSATNWSPEQFKEFCDIINNVTDDDKVQTVWNDKVQPVWGDQN